MKRLYCAVLCVMSMACAATTIPEFTLKAPDNCNPEQIDNLSRFTTEPKSGPFVGVPGKASRIDSERSPWVEGVKTLKIETQMSICAPGPCKQQPPFSEAEFKNYIAEEARLFQAEGIHYEISSDNYYSAETGIVEKAKIGLTDTTRQPTVKNFYYTRLTFKGVSCGTWETFPK